VLPGFPGHEDLTVADLGRSVQFYDQVLALIGHREPPPLCGRAGSTGDAMP
jgi:hypothetical protein